MDFLSKLRTFVWSKHFLKHTGLIILTYLIVVGGVVLYLDQYTNHGERIEVPALVGKKASQAQLILEEQNLQMELLDSVYRPDLPLGTIVYQDPLPTKKSDVYVKEGRIIRVQISKNTRMVEMPPLIDRSERFAESVLKNRGLRFTKVYRSTSEADGAVLEQHFKGRNIKEGTRIPIGSLIELIVGRNSAQQPVELPNLIGMTISEARGRLSGTSLSLLLGACEGCANAQDSTSAVISVQGPEYISAGTMIPAGTTITVSATRN